jgi:phosphopantothenoylcysteine decarboxylase / phosphopantothenate---cysteine ligase
MITGKTIVLGVTGGIAAFKAAALCSQLVQKGAKVHVILTKSAMQFIQPLTFQALSRNHVTTDTFEEKDPSKIAHIDLADRADFIVVAPATANFLAKAALGLADDMLTTTLLATEAPVMVCPAMNVHMYNHPAVQKNLSLLKTMGILFVEPGEGFLACGYVGKGRMAEPEQITKEIEHYFLSKKDLQGTRILITAGATRERIDPVRFLSNRSTGKMGYAIAQAARDRGAEVVLVSGVTNVNPLSGVQMVFIESAEEMFQAVVAHAGNADIIIKAAAVADYRPAAVHSQKMKKKDENLTIQLERTKDILHYLGQHKKAGQVLVGFAAETNNVMEYALDKINRKNLDFIAANNVAQEGAGFGVDTNIVQLYDKDGLIKSLPKMDKRNVAQQILDVAKMKLKDKEQCSQKL